MRALFYMGMGVLGIVVIGVGVWFAPLLSDSTGTPNDIPKIPNTGTLIVTTPTPAQNSSPSTPTYTAPRTIAIPLIGVYAEIQHLGVDNEGNMGTPSNTRDVSWYRHGPAPGQPGSAVIAGHVNNYLGFDGVFADLYKLSAGNDIYIYTATDQRIHFTVKTIRTYDYRTAPTNIIFDQDPSIGARLTLITCGGNWIPDEGTFDKRIVVYAELMQ